MEYSIFGLLILALDIWAIVNVAQSRSDLGVKVAWIVVILIFPVLGFIAWLIFGPKTAK
jgi:hypothetical protein